MPRRHAVLALVVAVFWAVNFVVIDIGLESFPPLLFAALRFGLIAFPCDLSRAADGRALAGSSSSPVQICALTI
jgi:drug/metabolite transporter (DMT)-like permease